MSYTNRFYELWEETIENDIGLTNDQRIAIVSILLSEENKDKRTAAMNSEPATKKQKKYMVDLQIPFQDDITKREASKLIDEAKKT